jgi:hypothetical protein
VLTAPRAHTCYVAYCQSPAGFAFLGVTGDQVDRVALPDGSRLRSCQGHLEVTMRNLAATFKTLPGGGPARLRAVPLLPETALPPRP